MQDGGSHEEILQNHLCRAGGFTGGVPFRRAAKGGEGRISNPQCRKGSFNITEQLTDEQIDRLETLLEGTTCTRWKNPIGSFRIVEDTVSIIGMDDDGLCIFTLVGADNRYDVRERNVKDGETLWKAVLEILP